MTARPERCEALGTIRIEKRSRAKQSLREQLSTAAGPRSLHFTGYKQAQASVRPGSKTEALARGVIG
jgi:hypothetical protein